jgi:ParB-like chromosome segregation protein Spo0J
MAASKGVKANEKKIVGLSVPQPTKVKLADLKFAPYNPRTISKEKLGALKASLVKHGMVLTLVVQRQSEQHGAMVLVGGHQRVRAVRELCAERGWAVPATVPAVVLDIGDAEARQLNVSLNNISGEFEPFKLGELFREIRPTMTMDDVLATGFGAGEIDDMIALLEPSPAAPPEPEKLDGFAASVTLSLEFATVEARDEAKALLKVAVQSGQKSGDLMLRAIKASSIVGKLGEVRHKAGHEKTTKGSVDRAGART